MTLGVTNEPKEDGWMQMSGNDKQTMDELERVAPKEGQRRAVKREGGERERERER